MKLYHAKPSPFARRVRVLLRERGLLSRIDEIASASTSLTAGATAPTAWSNFDSGRQLRIAGDAALVAPAATRQVRVRVRVQHTTLICETPELRWPLVKLAAPRSFCATGETSPAASSPVPHPSTKDST